MRAYINPPSRKFSHSEILELSALIREYIDANPQADQETLENGIVAISDMFDGAMQLRYQKPKA